MTRNFNRSGVPMRRVAMALTAVLALNPGVALAGASGSNEADAAAVAGALVIQSDPAGANVYVDGRLAGHTPLQVGSLTPGDHRVRVVKEGYLENARIVSLGTTPTNVHVKLTPHTGTSSAPAEQVSGAGGGGSRRWLWLGLAGAGAATAAVLVLTRNHAPDAGTISVTPTATGMAGVTSFSFTSTASDEDDDTLTYNWNFGDGSTSTSATPAHVFATVGTFNVTLTVSDGKEEVTTPGRSVTVGPSLAGVWTGGRDFQCGVNTTLTQSGGSLGGAMIFTGGCTGTISIVAGTVAATTHPATVTWTTAPYAFTGFSFLLTSRFVGATDGTGTVLTGTLTVSDVTGSSATATTFRR